MSSLTLCLVNPQIPPNTGTIARLAGATNSALHIVGKPGFDLSDSAVKRAGLDYWHLVDITLFPDIEAYFSALNPESCHFLSARATRLYTDVSYRSGDTLVFGSETVGLPVEFYTCYEDRLVQIPMVNRDKGMRSINLAIAAGIVLYEGIRQLGSLR